MINNPTVKIYKNVSMKSSVLSNYVSIGDFSQINDSTLDNNVRIDRNNYIADSVIGKFSYTGRNTIILHAKIGSFTCISWNVSIGGANHDYSRITQHSFLYNKDDTFLPENRMPAYDRFSSPLTIGHDVWIAAGAVITRGVTIGNGAVVGANAVVTKNIPPYAVVAGAPAKIIKYRFEPEIITLLNQLEWWQWSEEKIKKNFENLTKIPNKSFLEELLYDNNTF